MGLGDAFLPDAKVEIKVVELKELFRSEAADEVENRCLINGLKAGLPAEHILTMIGEEVNKDGAKPDHINGASGERARD